MPSAQYAFKTNSSAAALGRFYKQSRWQRHWAGLVNRFPSLT